MSALRIGDRVIDHLDGAGTVMQHLPGPFVDVEYDEPQPRTNYRGDPYTTTSSCIHVELLRRLYSDAAAETALW